MKNRMETRKWGVIMLVMGVSFCLMGAFFMGWGEPILGENHTGIATVIGILGIGAISKAKEVKE